MHTEEIIHEIERDLRSGKTIRGTIRRLHIPETSFRKRYPHLIAIARETKRRAELARLARICEALIAMRGECFAAVAKRIGETPNMVYKAYRRYYGIGDQPKDRLPSMV